MLGDPGRMPAVKASKPTKVSAKKPAVAKAKTSPSAGKDLPRKARKPAMLPRSDGDAGVQAYKSSSPAAKPKLLSGNLQIADAVRDRLAEVLRNA